MGINKRVVLLIAKTTNSKTAFSQATGISTVILSHISSGRNKVSLTAVEQILKAFPNINAEWLILGQGQIFKDGLDSSLTSELFENIEEMQSELEKFKKVTEIKILKIKSSLSSITD
ncbi:hypothetical protein OAD66_07225 [Bacteroidia bacterium]|nr:hypothetical protein [Bacteroidia bacterium]